MRNFLETLRFPWNGAGEDGFTHHAITLCMCHNTMWYSLFRLQSGRGCPAPSPPGRAALGTYGRRDRPFPTGTPPCHRPTTLDEGAQHGRIHRRTLQRIRTTESDLTRARDEGDDFLVEVEQAELDDLRRLAAEHGVEVGATSV